MADVFISYKSERRAAAEHLAEVLKRHGYDVWFDYGLIKGDDFDFQLDAQLRAAKAVIVLWCTMSVESPWVSREASLAGKLKTLLPVMIEDCELKLAHITADYIDLRRWDGSPRSHMLDQLFQELTRLTGRAPQLDWIALSDYEKTWRRFGALPLQAFALGKPVERPKTTDSQILRTEMVASRLDPQQAYNAIKDSDNIADWQAFVDTHSDHGLAIGARVRLKQLIMVRDQQAAVAAKQALEAEAEEVWRHLQHGYDDDAIAEFLARYGETTTGTEVKRIAEGRIRIDAPIIHGAPNGWFLPGNGKTEWFKDIEHGPEMVVIPAGKFMMGSPSGEDGRSDDEGRQHEVAISRPFAMGRFTVTLAEFSAFVDATDHKLPDEIYTYEDGKWESRKGRSFRNPGFEQSPRHPVVGINWEDTQAYIEWLNQQSGKTYRLLTEAEWEYACRAGATSPFWWGDTISTDQANYDGNYTYGNGKKGECRQKTVPVESFAPNSFGLYQMHGNVWEWCEDCWHGNYNGAPLDGTAWVTGNQTSRVLRGGSWLSSPLYLRSASRFRDLPDARSSGTGFRLARTLNP